MDMLGKIFQQLYKCLHMRMRLGVYTVVYVYVNIYTSIYIYMRTGYAYVHDSILMYMYVRPNFPQFDN